MGIYKLLLHVPGLKVLLRIVNNYVYHGDVRADSEFAGYYLWLRALAPNLILAFLLSCGTLSNLTLHIWNYGNLNFYALN